MGKEEKTEKQYIPMGGLFRHHLETFRQQAGSGKDPRKLIYDTLELELLSAKNDWVSELVEMAENDFPEKTYEIALLLCVANRKNLSLRYKDYIDRERFEEITEVTKGALRDDASDFFPEPKINVSILDEKGLSLSRISIKELFEAWNALPGTSIDSLENLKLPTRVSQIITKVIEINLLRKGVKKAWLLEASSQEYDETSVPGAKKLIAEFFSTMQEYEIPNLQELKKRIEKKMKEKELAVR